MTVTSGFLLLAVMLLCSACHRDTVGPPPRYAVLRFENLTGDASIEWTARAASEMLSRSLEGALTGPVLHPAALGRTTATLGSGPAGAPGISAEASKARVAGATRTITGYIEKSRARIRIAASERDLATLKTIRTVSAEGATPLDAINALARQFSSSAQPYYSNNPGAIRSYCIGLEAPNGDADLERATAADSAFGPAWSALVARQIARGDRQAATQTIARSVQYHIDDYDRATIEADRASLNNDRHARIDALKRLSAMSPGDTVLLRTVAEAEMDLGQFEDAAFTWNKLAAVLPDDANAWNLLAYSRAYLGDYQAALNAVREYQRLDPSSANTLDSEGDIHFLFRKFPEAARSYTAANTKNPAFMNHGELYKAAWATFGAGDLARADSLFAQFRSAREASHDASLPLYVADWLYRTGRKPQAVSQLRAQAGTASPAQQPLIYSQLAIWDVLAGDRTAAAADAASAGVPKSVPVFLARFCSLPSAPTEEWEARADKMLQGNAAPNIRLLAIGYALMLDGKTADAIPVWEHIVEKSGGTDFFVRGVLAKLRGEPLRQPIVPNAADLNEFAAVLNPPGK